MLIGMTLSASPKFLLMTSGLNMQTHRVPRPMSVASYIICVVTIDASMSVVFIPS